jgi:hypothetical protein
MKRLQPGFLLSLVACKYLKERGFELYDLGGTDSSPMMAYKVCIPPPPSGKKIVFFIIFMRMVVKEGVIALYYIIINNKNTNQLHDLCD